MTPDQFICNNTAVATAPLIPEILLHLATEVTPLWHATAELLDDAGVEPPFWAFAWPGGQAIARYILDHPETVSARHVLDIATGGGIAAIAAMKAGAATVTANDTDAFAIAVVQMNAALNDVVFDTCIDDLTATAPGKRWDVILAGDVFYDRAMATAIAPWLVARARDGTVVLAGDPGRAYVPETGLTRVASYEIPTSRDLEAGDCMTTVVWALDE